MSVGRTPPTPNSMRSAGESAGAGEGEKGEENVQFTSFLRSRMACVASHTTMFIRKMVEPVLMNRFMVGCRASIHAPRRQTKIGRKTGFSSFVGCSSRQSVLGLSAIAQWIAGRRTAPQCYRVERTRGGGVGVRRGAASFVVRSCLKNSTACTTSTAGREAHIHTESGYTHREQCVSLSATCWGQTWNSKQWNTSGSA